MTYFHSFQSCYILVQAHIYVLFSTSQCYLCLILRDFIDNQQQEVLGGLFLQVFNVLSLVIKARSASGIRVCVIGQSKNKTGGGRVNCSSRFLIQFCHKSSSSYYIFYCHLDYVHIQCPLSGVKWRLASKVKR